MKLQVVLSDGTDYTWVPGERARGGWLKKDGVRVAWCWGLLDALRLLLDDEVDTPIESIELTTTTGRRIVWRDGDDDLEGLPPSLRRQVTLNHFLSRLLV
jgi:hypothetical protein